MEKCYRNKIIIIYYSIQRESGFYNVSFLCMLRKQRHVVLLMLYVMPGQKKTKQNQQHSHVRDVDFTLLSVFSVIFGQIHCLFSPISSFSFRTFCLFLCSFSVRRHAHVDFQLFSQKSSGIPDMYRMYMKPSQQQ